MRKQITKRVPMAQVPLVGYPQFNLDYLPLLLYNDYNMYEKQPQKIIKVGDSLALIIPAMACRDLDISRGDFFEVVIYDRDVLFARRVKVVPQGPALEYMGKKLTE